MNDSMGSEARRTGPLTDDELASLLGDKISQEERAELNARLENDPAGSEVLAMAASVEDDQSGGGLDKGKVDELLKMVNDGLAIEDICEHCGGDLHPGGKFCPHCGVNQLEKSVKCFKCGTTVIEGSYYCFKCGNVL
ncbi:MAG TPA: zinc ribbon domain-containing protein, partial [bacterium]